MKAWTFLFTDIEGSTVLFERAPVAYAEARGRHEALLHERIAQRGGEVFRGTGDGVLAVFERSEAALATAVACQEALAAAEWPAGIGELRVRIGLHRGVAERGGDDFHGLVMHHATRVLDAGHGRQIVCSEAVVDDAGEEWRGRLVDLGFYRLRGVSAPVRLFQVPYAGAPAEGFPPLRTPAAFTHRLPAPPTRFFGREAELLDLASMLAPEPPGGAPRPHGRLVSLLGPGGTGKTRLSLAVAERLRGAYSHAVWFVPLAEVRDASLLPEILREALQILPEAGVAPLTQVGQFLNAQPALLVLDNFEQLVPAGVETVRVLLERGPQLVCLVSSRVRLDLQAEQDFGLAPLLLPPATGTPEEFLRYPSVQLYCDRARAARREFQLTVENAADVAQVCRVLEGMPLALEIAAARATVLTPAQTLSKLERRLDFLVSRKQDFAQRHRTLRATIAWSYELLAEPLQRSFARLSIFRGGWTLEAAEAVAGKDGALAVLEDLAELQGGSLIVAEERDGAMRYRMLEVIREFAEERLSREEHATVIDRCHAWFAALAEDDSETDEARRLRTLEADHDNLRAMLAGPRPAEERLRAAVALYWFWEIRGYFREGRAWLRRLRAGVEDARLQARAANSAGILAAAEGDFDDARAQLESALAYWEQAGEDRNAAASLNSLGIVACDSRDHAAAALCYARSLALFRQLGARSEMAAVLGNLGENALMTGDLPGARSALTEALGIQRELGEQWRIANTLHTLAELHCHEGDCAVARPVLAECIAIRTSLGARDWLAPALVTLVEIALAEGRTDTAAQLCGAAHAAAESAAARLAPVFEAKLAEHSARLKSQLGEREFLRHGGRGRELRIEQVLTPAGAWRLNLDSHDGSRP